MRTYRLFSLLALIAVAIPGTVNSQDGAAADWRLERVEDRDAVLALITFTNGIVLVSRCVAGVYDLTITGLPEPVQHDVFTRQLGFSVGDDAMSESAWTIADDRTSAFSRLPAVVARRLAKGGRLQIRVPADGTRRPTRYIMELEPSSAALATTLTECGRPLVDTRDAYIEGDGQSLPSGSTWVRPPQIQFPAANPSRGRSGLGYVGMTCAVTAEGRLSDCIVESEHPGGFGFGAAVLRGIPRARVTPRVDGESAVIAFSVTFRID